MANRFAIRNFYCWYDVIRLNSPLCGLQFFSGDSCSVGSAPLTWLAVGSALLRNSQLAVGSASLRDLQWADVQWWAGLPFAQASGD